MSFRFIFFLFLSLAAFGGTGCNIINPAEEIPTYLQVDSFQFEKNRTDNTGGTTHQIRSVFAVYNGRNIGGFDLPARIPVLASGTGELILFPMVDNSGLFSYQLQYAHYTPYKTTLTADPGKTIAIAAKTGYTALSNFYYVEDFENSNDFVTVSGAPVANTTDPAEVLDGTRSGKFSVDTGGLTTTVTTNRKFVFVSTNSEPVLELDYKSTAYLRVGIYAENYTQPNYFLTLLPSPKANKVYIPLQQAIAKLGSGAANFHFAFQIYPDGDAKSGYVIVDDVKAVLF